ncbi:hypothetical protein [Streptomyces atratus]
MPAIAACPDADVPARLRAAVHRAEPAGGGEDDVPVETDGFTVDPAAKAR